MAAAQVKSSCLHDTDRNRESSRRELVASSSSAISVSLAARWAGHGREELATKKYGLLPQSQHQSRAQKGGGYGVERQ